MCGIAAILLHPQERSTEQWRNICKTFTLNLLANEERGRAATGVACIRTDNQVSLLKMPLPASNFIKTPEYQSILSAVDRHASLILGHTRLPTKGNPNNTENNHPLQAGPIIGVHNGQIDNDDQLFTSLALVRQAEVDSEIIFRLLEKISPISSDTDYLRDARSLLRHLRGQYAFLACDQRTPGRLLVLRHNSPLSYYFHIEWNALIFSSRYIFLRKTFSSPTAVSALEHDQLFLFDAFSVTILNDQPICSLKFTPEN